MALSLRAACRRAWRDVVMKWAIICAILSSSVSGAFAGDLASASPLEQPTDVSGTMEFTDGAGRPIGSITKIGGVTYFTGADGRPLGVATMINGHRVFKTY